MLFEKEKNFVKNDGTTVLMAMIESRMGKYFEDNTNISFKNFINEQVGKRDVNGNTALMKIVKVNNLVQEKKSYDDQSISSYP